ncbi:hypothetical protein DOM21_07470 [Bacteriovorax stolpii]|uniref:glycosyltransferase family 4 protein n=1 Tax=Bacteriovorax stolpii TaxID=960 RepID=UPI001157FAE2|nr:glycosyltransferase family 4 protein [Bacteriovorax stolpii]QDK41296.1 hypothetical protein DOM21_07470 [Bacteriovorax stolpii]
MKVAITCDYLLGRSHYVEIIENLCEVFPEAPIYCFAHKKGAILGHIEQRSIKSTYLSNIVSTEEEFYQHSNKIPSLAKNLFVSCEYDLIINISKGFSQGLAKCETTKLITYLYDLDLDSKIKKTFMQKILSPMVFSWIKKSLGQADKVLSSREDLLTTLHDLKNTEVIPPPFRVSDYALFPKDMFKHHFFLIEAKGLNINEATNLIEWMKEWNYSFQFIGPDAHLSSIKSNFPENTFFGDRCSGEHAPVLASSKALVTFNTEDFPALALGTLATGRPVILAKPLSKWLSGLGVDYISHFDKAEIKKALDNVISDSVLETQKLRAHVMEYHDIKFKAQMKRTLDKAFHEIHPHDHTHSSDCSQCK